MYRRMIIRRPRSRGIGSVVMSTDMLATALPVQEAAPGHNTARDASIYGDAQSLIGPRIRANRAPAGSPPPPPPPPAYDPGFLETSPEVYSDSSGGGSTSDSASDSTDDAKGLSFWGPVALVGLSVIGAIWIIRS